MTFAAIVFRSPSADRGASSDICTSFSTAFQSRERPYMDAYMDASDFARETLCDGVGTAAALYSAFSVEHSSTGPDEIR
jgi:hypothetical protein